jgi:PIN domain nuclease of toxin-antitoxin system
MKLLLDTHAFLWWDDDYKKLPDKVFKAISDPSNQVYLSLASIWEMQIKFQLGKLKFDIPLATKLQDHSSKNGLKFLAISKKHIFALSDLPMHHRDPFDRLLIAQARTNNLLFVTHDADNQKYDVSILWDK